MRPLLFALLLTAAACTQSVQLHNPATGQTATCGPYRTTGVSGAGATLLIDCVDDFERQGFQRIPD